MIGLKWFQIGVCQLLCFDLFVDCFLRVYWLIVWFNHKLIVLREWFHFDCNDKQWEITHFSLSTQFLSNTNFLEIFFAFYQFPIKKYIISQKIWGILCFLGVEQVNSNQNQSKSTISTSFLDRLQKWVSFLLERWWESSVCSSSFFCPFLPIWH